MIQFSCSFACSKSGWTHHAWSWMSVKPQRWWWSSPAVKRELVVAATTMIHHDTTLNNQLKIQNPEEVLPKDVPTHKTELLSPRTSYWHPSTMFKHSPCVTTVHHHILQDRNCWHIMKVWFEDFSSPPEPWEWSPVCAIHTCKAIVQMST